MRDSEEQEQDEILEVLKELNLQLATYDPPINGLRSIRVVIDPKFNSPPSRKVEITCAYESGASRRMEVIEISCLHDFMGQISRAGKVTNYPAWGPLLIVISITPSNIVFAVLQYLRNEAGMAHQGHNRETYAQYRLP